MIEVLIADDHQLFAEGLEMALDALPDLKVVGVVGDGETMLEWLESKEADILILDVEMPGAGGLVSLEQVPEPTKAIVVSMHADRSTREKAAATGAWAFYSKSVPLNELAAAVRAVAAGERLIDLDQAAVSEILSRHVHPQFDPAAASLTRREVEILQLMATGLSTTEELADRLFISHKTVKNHLANIFAKLGVGDRTQAVVEAIRVGLVRAK